MHDDLLAQAEALARLDAKKPKQVNLRRAISSAYYAVFHCLVHHACCAQSELTMLRRLIAMSSAALSLITQ